MRLKVDAFEDIATYCARINIFNLCWKLPDYVASPSNFDFKYIRQEKALNRQWQDETGGEYDQYNQCRYLAATLSAMPIAKCHHRRVAAPAGAMSATVTPLAMAFTLELGKGLKGSQTLFRAQIENRIAN